ncbi:MAG: ribosome biogenesis GTP-binding protein YihA/YsxC [Candidatus Parcubacteria bacterium]|jgi:GTP-binding protein|nr:MAG: ribosome biogenesis GTP-binding protein YihA/YsxC [Candidatus Parcubacteria bacterium]
MLKEKTNSKTPPPKFLKTAMGADPIFSTETPQVAFIGRSNVGKSSTLNALTGAKKLAIASATPGRTRGINIFSWENLYLVDLPGYGYAKLPNKERQRLSELMGWYLFNDSFSPRLVVQVIDARLGPTPADLEILELLEANERRVLIIANKSDKLKAGDRAKIRRLLTTKLGSRPVFFYSAQTGIGVPEIRQEILC